MVNKSGPARLLEPSTEWHFAHATLCSLLNNSRPRVALPSWPMAKSRYSRSCRAGSAAGLCVCESAAQTEEIVARKRLTLKIELRHITSRMVYQTQPSICEHYRVLRVP